MLAQNFKTAADLGISDIELDALIKVLGMLERGELVHGKYPLASSFRKPNEFNMGVTLKRYGECGTVGCLMGWAHVVSGNKAFKACINRTFQNEADIMAVLPGNLTDLFGLKERVALLSDRTPAQSATALRSYLTTGDANWAEALSCG